MIEVVSGTIPGVLVVRPTVRRDPRGRFIKIVEEQIFAEHGIPTRYAEQYYSVSEQNVLRGLHFQAPPHDHCKLVTCVEGQVFDAVVDLRKNSPTFGQHQSFELSGEHGDTVFVPSGCAHGFYVRSKSAVTLYSVGSLHAASHDTGIHWDSVGIAWPSRNPLVSDRDAALVRFQNLETPFAMAPALSQEAARAVRRA